MRYEATSRQTKLMLAESLKGLMRVKPLSRITVSEIVRDCAVNRKTFYYHFEDIYALLKWMLEDEALQIVSHFDLPGDCEAAIRFIMSYVEQNDYIINCAYDSVGREGMKQFFCADFIRVVSSMIEETEAEAGKRLEPDFRAYAVRFYSEAIASMLLDWAKNGKTQDREQTVRYLVRIISAATESMKTQIAAQR